jgi:hypothetical protein
MSRRLVWIACLAFIIAYAALLRLDAITLSYGPVERPGWLKAFQESRGPESVLRPSGMTWTAAPVYPHADGTSTHYISDPYTYLQYAREMDSFFEAHRREPLFPAVTKAFLALFADQDVAVSFASATFSVLSVILTAILGASVFSRPVGLVAAGALAIEYDAISWGIAGWRDDAFTCGVLASAWLMVRYLRKPSGLNAVALGVVAAARVSSGSQPSRFSCRAPLFLSLCCVAGAGLAGLRSHTGRLQRPRSSAHFSSTAGSCSAIPSMRSTCTLTCTVRQEGRSKPADPRPSILYGRESGGRLKPWTPRSLA